MPGYLPLRNPAVLAEMLVILTGYEINPDAFQHPVLQLGRVKLYNPICHTTHVAAEFCVVLHNRR